MKAAEANKSTFSTQKVYTYTLRLSRLAGFLLVLAMAASLLGIWDEPCGPGYWAMDAAALEAQEANSFH